MRGCDLQAERRIIYEKGCESGAFVFSKRMVEADRGDISGGIVRIQRDDESLGSGWAVQFEARRELSAAYPGAA
ncbi:MAG: hypothetical protein LBG43_07665 [Treponema sp.]|jgi:hypothetical protein|nr:hypothetical protein [Treponema sp.]